MHTAETNGPFEVLLIEDNPVDARLLREVLMEAGAPRFKLTHTDRLSKGLDRLAEGRVDVILLDLSLPDSHGFDTFLRVRRQAPEVPIVVLSGLDDETFSVKAVQEGAQDYLVKGRVDGHLLVRAIRYAIERQRAEEEIKKRTRELELLNAELARANRHKSEFIANMSHDLRTPLNAVIGFSEILLGQGFGPLNEKQKRQVTSIFASGKHLLELINDILDLSKVEAGKMELALECFSLSELVREVSGTINVLALKKGITFQAPSADGDMEISADKGRLTQIMYNLLSNAVKFTPPGGRVALEVVDEADLVKIAVLDTGIGIDPKDHERIFVAFEQVDSSRSKEHQGTGLGLTLVRKFVQMHGGRIWVESEPGQGSRFTLTIPKGLKGGPPAAAGQEAIAGGRLHAAARADGPESPAILIVEDDPTNAQLLSDALEPKGYRIHQADTAQAGIELARAKRPELIIMDIGLPGMDGLEATKILKQDHATRQIPIIVMTAYAMKGDRESALAAGCDEYITKPINTCDVVEKISRVLGRQA